MNAALEQLAQPCEVARELELAIGADQRLQELGVRGAPGRDDHELGAGRGQVLDDARGVLGRPVQRAPVRHEQDERAAIRDAAFGGELVERVQDVRGTAWHLGRQERHERATQRVRARSPRREHRALERSGEEPQLEAILGGRADDELEHRATHALERLTDHAARTVDHQDHVPRFVVLEVGLERKQFGDAVRSATPSAERSVAAERQPAPAALYETDEAGRQLAGTDRVGDQEVCARERALQVDEVAGAQAHPLERRAGQEPCSGVRSRAVSRTLEHHDLERIAHPQRTRERVVLRNRVADDRPRPTGRSRRRLDAHDVVTGVGRGKHQVGTPARRGPGRRGCAGNRNAPLVTRPASATLELDDHVQRVRARATAGTPREVHPDDQRSAGFDAGRYAQSLQREVVAVDRRQRTRVPLHACFRQALDPRIRVRSRVRAVADPSNADRSTRRIDQRGVQRREDRVEIAPARSGQSAGGRIGIAADSVQPVLELLEGTGTMVDHVLTRVADDTELARRLGDCAACLAQHGPHRVSPVRVQSNRTRRRIDQDQVQFGPFGGSCASLARPGEPGAHGEAGDGGQRTPRHPLGVRNRSQRPRARRGSSNGSSRRRGRGLRGRTPHLVRVRPRAEARRIPRPPHRR